MARTGPRSLSTGRQRRAVTIDSNHQTPHLLAPDFGRKVSDDSLLPAARAKPRRAESVHIPFRCSWTNWTAIAPSPTAEVKRFTEPDRTSPAANTPGRLVSSRNG